MDNSLYLFVSLTSYLLFMICIGIYFYRKTDTLDDYVLGGRGLNSWVSALSASASSMSGWLVLGLPGGIYRQGLSSASWIAIGLSIGTYLNWRFVAARLRDYTERANNSLTLSDYFENRFNDTSKILRIFSAIIIIIFFCLYVASGFVAGAKLFETIFNIPYTLSLIIGFIVIVSYTFLGGFNAVSWTDFFQGTLIFIAIIAVPLFTYIALGGINQTHLEINEIQPYFMNLFRQKDGTALPFLSIVSMLAFGLGYFGQPHILARFMAIKNSSAVKQARIIGVTWSVITYAGGVFVGIVGFAYFKTNIPDAETIFINMIHALFHPVIAGFLLAAILAAIMSTADSQLLVTSSALTQDFYRVLFNKEATQKQLIWCGRISVFLFALIAVLVARNPESNVFDIVRYAWSGLGASFGPVIIFSLYWKKMTKQGALTGMITGGAMIIIWANLSGGIFDIYEILPAFIIASLGIIIVSLITFEKSSVKI